VDFLLELLSEVSISILPESAERLQQVLEDKAKIVSIDESGVCPFTDANLKAISLTSDQRLRVQQALLDLAGGQGEAGDDLREALETFSSWMKERPEPFTVDAPNVAYNRQNFEGGRFSFQQVEMVLRALQAEGHRAFVLLPWKYMQPVIPNHARYTGYSSSSRHELTPEEQSIIDKWEEEGVLGVTPFGASDDWFWMMASVSGDQGVYVVSNDQMRDHRISLLTVEPNPRTKHLKLQIQSPRSAVDPCASS